jgi:hypothetical protein
LDAAAAEILLHLSCPFYPAVIAAQPPTPFVDLRATAPSEREVL